MLLSTEERQPSVLENSFDSAQLDSRRLKTLVDNPGSLTEISKKYLESGRKKKKRKRRSKQMPETSLWELGRNVLQTFPFSHTHKPGMND
jgi:hypothetical protein